MKLPPRKRFRFPLLEIKFAIEAQGSCCQHKSKEAAESKLFYFEYSNENLLVRDAVAILQPNKI